MRRVVWLRRVVVLAAVAVLATACGGEAESEPEAGLEPEAAAEPEPAAEPAPGDGVESAVSSQPVVSEAVAGLAAALGSVDPSVPPLGNYDGSTRLMGQVF